MSFPLALGATAPLSSVSHATFLLPKAFPVSPPRGLDRGTFIHLPNSQDVPPFFPALLRGRRCGELLPTWGFAASKPPVQTFARGRGWKRDPGAVPVAGSRPRLPGRIRDAGAHAVPTPALCLHKGE